MAVIRTHQLTKSYGRTVALDRLDLTVDAGEVVGYLGPNGAGKTTTIRLLLALTSPTAGRAELFDQDAHRHPAALHRRIGYVPGDVALWPHLTGAQTLDLLGDLHGTVDRQRRESLIDRFAFDPTKKVSSYSKGNRQKLALIAAFMTRPELLILDEPTSGLDPLMEEVFKATVLEARSEGAAVLLSSHILSEVEALCDRVGILRDGRLVESGTLASLRLVHSVHVEARFESDVPDLRGVPGVSDVVVDGLAVRCRCDGPMGPLLSVLGATGAVQVISREPSLEELFLTHYDATAPRPHPEHVATGELVLDDASPVVVHDAR